MRAAAVLQLLARTHEVTLVVEPRYSPLFGRPEAEIEAACAQVVILPRPDTGKAGLLNRLVRLMAPRAEVGYDFVTRPFDVMHVFRLAMLETAGDIHHQLPAPRPALHLDMDDVESEAIRAIAELHRKNGATKSASAADLAATHALERERDALARYARVYVCSEKDRARLAERGLRSELVVLPNTYDVVPGARRPGANERFTMLFVGTLGYTPNADAVRWLCSEIVPRMERLTTRDFRVIIAGGGATPDLSAVARHPRVQHVGPAPEVATLYAQAHVAVVPIRAGGGTRIKALESFAYGCPVVSTGIGLAGIDARAGEHALVADGAEAFAAACVRLMDEPGLADRLAAAARDLVESRYSTAAVAAMLEALPA
jgi:polysaccharide biosynthesis protein PslH